MKLLFVGFFSLSSAMALSTAYAQTATINVATIKAQFSENMKKICDEGADVNDVSQALDAQLPVIDGLVKLDVETHKTELSSLILDSSEDTLGTVVNAEYSCIINKKKQLLDKNPKMLRELHDSEAHKQINNLLQRVYLQNLAIVNIGIALTK